MYIHKIITIASYNQGTNIPNKQNTKSIALIIIS